MLSTHKLNTVGILSIGLIEQHLSQTYEACRLCNRIDQWMDGDGWHIRNMLVGISDSRDFLYTTVICYILVASRPEFEILLSDILLLNIGNSTLFPFYTIE